MVIFAGGRLTKIDLKEAEGILPDEYLQNLEKEVSGDELLERDGITIKDGEVPPEGVPITRILNVKPIKKIGPTCWAAVVASIINLLKNKSLTVEDVAKYVYGNDWKKMGAWADYVKAYHHWGLYPNLTGVISFSQIKKNINSGKPLQLRMEEHTVALVGYKELSKAQENKSYRILVLMEPNSAELVTVALNSAGNFYYNVGGGKDAWKTTGVF